MEKLKQFFGDVKGIKMNFKINFVMGILSGFIIPIILNKGIKLSMFNQTFFSILLFLVLYLALYMSYIKHESNIQKSLISALFTLFIVNLIYEMKDYINAFIFILIYILHLKIISNKKADESTLKQYYILILVGFAFEIIHAIIVRELPSLLTFIPSTTLLIGIDTRIYMYKEKREKLIAEGKWNENTKKEAKKIFDI